MKEYRAFVQALAEPMPGSELVWLKCVGAKDALRPGQFVMGELVKKSTRFLRQPLPVYSSTDGGLAVLVSAHAFGPLAVGDELSLAGPCGRAIELPSGTSRIGLLCEGSYPIPLIGMVSEGTAGHLVVHPPTSGQAFPSAFLPESIEYSCFPGAEGAESFWRTISEVCVWSDVIFASGSDAFYVRLAQEVRSIRPSAEAGFGSVWHMEHVTCGMGRCNGCAVRTPRGVRYECMDGPFLNLGDYA